MYIIRKQIKFEYKGARKERNNKEGAPLQERVRRVILIYQREHSRNIRNKGRPSLKEISIMI